MAEQIQATKGVTWEERTTYTARGFPRVEIVITHKYLNKVRVIRDASYSVAASKATACIRSWDKKWHAQKLTLSLQATAEQKTAQAQAALRALQGILHDGLHASHRVEWAEWELPFTEKVPPRPELKALPKRPIKPDEPWEEPNEKSAKYSPGWMSLFFPSIKKMLGNALSGTT